MGGIATQIRWEDTATVAVDTDWFGADIIGRANTAVKHTISIMVPTGTVVNLQTVFNTFTKELNINDGIALVANSLYEFDMIVYPGMSYNIQHKTGTLNVMAYISESPNTDV